MIVVDASVAVKWFFPEAGAEEAQKVLACAERLAAPALIRVEVAAAIAGKARFNEIHDEDAEAAASLWFRALDNGVIALFPDEADIGPAVKLALQLKHLLQDCLYLALAERIGAKLITADQNLVGKASGVHASIRPLLGQSQPDSTRVE